MAIYKTAPTERIIHLRESNRSVALVRLDNLALLHLLVGVRRPDNLTSFVDHREGGEAIALSELTTPARGDGIISTVGGTTIGLRGSVSLHDVGASGGITGAGVDAKGPSAGGVFGVADTLGVLKGPLGAGGHHGLGRGGGSEGRSTEARGEEKLGELHGELVDLNLVVDRNLIDFSMEYRKTEDTQAIYVFPSSTSLEIKMSSK